MLFFFVLHMSCYTYEFNNWFSDAKTAFWWYMLHNHKDDIQLLIAIRLKYNSCALKNKNVLSIGITTNCSIKYSLYCLRLTPIVQQCFAASMIKLFQFWLKEFI